MPGSSVKVEQVIGDCDWQALAQKGTCLPTTSQTVTRFNVLGNGQGGSFEDNGKLIFLFGDTISGTAKPVNYHGHEPIGWSTSTDPEAGLLVNFFTNPDGTPLLVLPPGLPMGPDDVPNAGISLSDGIYLLCNVGSDTSLPNPQVNDYSVLVRFDENAHTFTVGRTVSRLPGGHFIFTSMHKSGTDVLMFGAGSYRASDIFLSTTPASSFASGTGTRYFTGLVNGQPTWSTTESDAVPIVQDNPLNGPAWPNDSPTIGNLSVVYSSDLGLWLMTYDGGRQQSSTKGAFIKGTYFTYAQQPWGPWAAPQLIFNEVRDNAYGVFVHNPNILPNPPGDGLNGPVIGQNDPYTTSGGTFAPLMIERFIRVVGDRLKIYYNISTWNPYTVVLMRSELAIATGPPPTMSLDRTALQFGATRSGGSFASQTTSQTVRLTQTGSGSVFWTATSNQPWLIVSPASGSGSATLTVSVAPSAGLPVSGLSNGSIALAFTGAANTAGPIAVGLTTMSNGASTPPVGLIDTPTDGITGVTGSIAVTGWALDDVEVRQVRLVRDPVTGEGPAQVFIGAAVLVDGSRPDVAALNPTTPRNTRAGWGYLLLTNFLPSQGNGTFRLYAIADDADGHSTTLGSKTITCSNSTATRPFGAIDTPVQGDVISGTSYNNFGWVLSRGPALAYPPNGTVSLVLDGAFGASPTGWGSRSDLTALFPAATYPGVTNALGVLTLDTTMLANGVHTIAWVVTASNGQADGIGSRYFTVANGSNLTVDPLEVPVASAFGRRTLREEVNAAPLDGTPISGRRGYDIDTPLRRLPVSSSSGRTTIQGEELDRFELHFGATDQLGPAETYTGYMRIGEGLGPLPIGSHLDASTGEFTWQPGVGFVHAYDLAFVRWRHGRASARQEVQIVLNPKGSNRVGPQVVIDTPGSAGATAGTPVSVGRSFLIAGWAIDLDAGTGTGVDTLHVWAYPRRACDGGACDAPIFLGAASYGGARPDVAAIFGDRFRESGYGITVETLPPGTYDLAVFAWSTATGGFVPGKVVRVTVN